MPMAIRKGIQGAAVAREAKRRAEAKENGVVLERESKKAVKRRRGGGGREVGGPSVGRMSGAELRLSERDVRSIEGPKKRNGAGKKKGRR